MQVRSLVSWLLAAVVVTSNPLKSSPAQNGKPSLPLTVTTIHQFDVPFWAENLAIRKNGQILVTRLDTPALLQVDPTGVVPPITITTWNATIYKGALGITETHDDIFYVLVAAPVDADFNKVSGTCSVFKIDMNPLSATSEGVIQIGPTVTKVTDIPEANFFDGATTLDDHHILAADPHDGWVYKINVITGKYHVVINDAKMKYTPDADFQLGVNGLKIKDSFLYWTNTASSTLNRILIDAKGAPIGLSSVVASVGAPDDFVFKNDGTTWIMRNTEEVLSYLPFGSSNPILVAGAATSTLLAGVTAGHFGRLEGDKHKLYVTTNGGLAVPVNGSIVVGGKVAYIDTTGF